MQYNCGEKKGDATARKVGAFKLVKNRLANLEALNQYYINFAEEHGYVETFADSWVDPDRGYPIKCKVTEEGNVLSTVPLNYSIQGTAMWCTGVAMVAVENFLVDLRKKNGWDGRQIIQVHDEVVVDLPKRACPIKNKKASNYYLVKEIQRLMEQSGIRVGINLPVNIELHSSHWAEKTTIV